MPSLPSSAVAGPLTSAYLHGLEQAVTDTWNPARARLYQGTAGTTLTAGVWTAVPFDSEEYDLPSPGGHSTSSNLGKYFCQTGWAGRYLVIGYLQTSSFPGLLGISINGANPTRDNTVANGLWLITTEVVLAAGDYITLSALFSPSAGTTSIASGVSSWMSVRWVGTS